MPKAGKVIDLCAALSQATEVPTDKVSVPTLSFAVHNYIQTKINALMLYFVVKVDVVNLLI